MKKESVTNILRIFFYLSSNSQIFYAIYILVTPPKTLFFLLRSPPCKTTCLDHVIKAPIISGFRLGSTSGETRHWIWRKKELEVEIFIYSFAQYINFFQVLVTCVFLHVLMARDGNNFRLLDTFSLVFFFILH